MSAVTGLEAPRVVVATAPLPAGDGPPDAEAVAALSAGERAHVARLRPGPAARFAAARALLRATLGAEAGVAPSELRLGADPRGKLVPAGAATGWRCNVSHTDDLAAVAVARGVEVGIDVERVGGRRRVLPSVLAPEEAASVAAAGGSGPLRAEGAEEDAANGRLAAFLRAWTRKEAFLKGVGCGLSVEPALVAVADRGPRDGPLLLRAPAELGDPAAWRLVDLDVGPQHVGALAVAAAAPAIVRRAPRSLGGRSPSDDRTPPSSRRTPAPGDRFAG